ncbi:MAG: hypothetical protein JEZ12_24055 [Desulfobacterium sp.]|nr:hypothetical protein [Desulfobacterium sp.]
MRNLMLNIQALLREKLNDVRNRDVFLSPDLSIVPESVKFPCIGIKDGKVGRKELSGGVLELTLPVEIAVYERLIRESETVLNTLAVCEAVHIALKGNYLGDYVKAVTSRDESPTQVLYKKQALILRKIVPYTYEREE